MDLKHHDFFLGQNPRLLMECLRSPGPGNTRVLRLRGLDVVLEMTGAVKMHNQNQMLKFLVGILIPMIF